MHRVVGNGLLIMLFHGGFIMSVIGGCLWPYVHSNPSPTQVIIMTSIIGIVCAASSHAFGWIISLFEALARALASYELHVPFLMKLGIKISLSALHLILHFYYQADIELIGALTTLSTLLICGFKLVGGVRENLFMVPFIAHQYAIIIVEITMNIKPAKYDYTSAVTLALIPIIFAVIALVTPNPPLSYHLMIDNA